jgi:hypothetical protein
MSMKPLAVASLILLALPACGGPKEEDVLTGDKIRASQSAPELPDVQLSENPEPPPAPPPPPEPTVNELNNAVDENVIEAGVPGNIPPAFQGLWGVTASDCRPGEVAGNAVLLTGDQIISADSVASLAGVLGDSPQRFEGRFTGAGGYESHEQLVLGGGGNLLTRSSGGERTVYQRCIGASR